MPTVEQQLNAIHRAVKNGFKPVTDLEQYGDDEKWVMPANEHQVTGDCEDFALACRSLCRKAGLKTRLVLCIAQGEGHCVLECNGWILDNLLPYVTSRDLLPYTWLKISGYDPGDPWHHIIN